MKKKNLSATLYQVCRIALGLIFLASGFVKGIDPHGTEYKITDYLLAWDLASALPDWLPLAGSLVLSFAEVLLGACLLMGIGERLARCGVLLFMLVMTPLTLWLALTDPVSDCGCFGDALVLSNWQTFGKNVVLLGLAIGLCCMSRWHGQQKEERQQSEPRRWAYVCWSMVLLAQALVEWWGLYYLPLIDFRPYHVGADLVAGMSIPEDAPRDEYESTFILEKDGVRREFTLDDYPDTTWTFIDSEVRLVKKGYEPPIHDFSIRLADTHEDVTQQVLTARQVALLLSTDLSLCDPTFDEEIVALAHRCNQQHIPLLVLTASTGEQTQRWLERLEVAELVIANTDKTTLKTMIRSNPGLMLLSHGVVTGKWSRHSLGNAAIGQTE